MPPAKVPGARVTTNCPICGKEFWYYRSWPRKYCSHACAGKAIVGNIARHAASRFTATCEQCGKEFETTPKRTRGRFCSLRCYGDWMKAHAPRGESHHQAGKPFGRSALPPNPVIMTCPICEKTFEAKPSSAHRRRCCSRQCYGQWMADNGLINGASNPNWKGGVVPAYYGPDWREAQRQARARDQVCLGCGVGPDELGRELDVHHLTPFRSFGLDHHAEANRLDNLVSLCPACHKRWEHSGRRPTG
jgi:endogenous inhibitor of DNA gyrase (YacG/DUF329 family)